MDKVDKGFFASEFVVYKGLDFTKIDFCEMEPNTKEDGSTVVEKGVVQRITLPNTLARHLMKIFANMFEEDSTGEK